MLRKFVFGSHYADDGKTWVDDGTGEGIEFELQDDGRLSVFHITPYYEQGRFLTVDAFARLREWLNENCESQN